MPISLAGAGDVSGENSGTNPGDWPRPKNFFGGGDASVGGMDGSLITLTLVDDAGLSRREKSRRIGLSES